MHICDPTPSTHLHLAADANCSLARTDPELDIFGHMLRAGEPAPADDVADARLQLLLQLASCIACHGVAEYRALLDRALAWKMAPTQLREVVYHALPYVGMAKLRDMLETTNAVFIEHGITLPQPTQATTDATNRMATGLQEQTTIFGAGITRIQAQAPVDQRHIQRTLTGNCFGDIYTRNGLDLQERELLTFAMLAALGGCEPQLAAHVAGNLAVGNDRRMLVACVTAILPVIGYPRSLNALRLVNEGTTATAPADSDCAQRPMPPLRPMPGIRRC